MGGEACRLEAYKLVNKPSKIYPQPDQDPFLSATCLLQAAVLSSAPHSKDPSKQPAVPTIFAALGCQVVSLAVAQPKRGLVFYSDSSYLAVTLPPHNLTSKCIFALNSSL